MNDTLKEIVQTQLGNAFKQNTHMNAVLRSMMKVIDFPSSVSRKSLYDNMLDAGFNKFQSDSYAYGSITTEEMLKIVEQFTQSSQRAAMSSVYVNPDTRKKNHDNRRTS